jgi:hypothetical protein
MGLTTDTDIYSDNLYNTPFVEIEIELDKQYSNYKLWFSDIDSSVKSECENRRYLLTKLFYTLICYCTIDIEDQYIYQTNGVVIENNIVHRNDFYETINNSGTVEEYNKNPIVIDSDDYTHIIYTTKPDDIYCLNYITNKTGSWVNSEIYSSSYPGELIMFSAMKKDSNDYLHISFSDGTSNVRYATNKTGSWVFTTIATGTGLCYTSIAVDSNDFVHIVYSDISFGLIHVTNESGSWVSDTIDGTEYSGSTMSMMIDSDDYIYISYYDQNINGLRYVTNKTGSWINTLIDSLTGGVLGVCSSITRDSNDNIYISYVDYTNGNLKYATNESGSWDIETIDSVGTNWYAYTSIVVDVYNNPVISYYNHTSHSLKQAKFENSEWILTTIDNSSDVGGYNSVALDSYANIRISYIDTTNKNLKYYEYNPPEIVDLYSLTNYLLIFNDSTTEEFELGSYEEDLTYYYWSIDNIFIEDKVVIGIILRDEDDVSYISISNPEIEIVKDDKLIYYIRISKSIVDPFTTLYFDDGTIAQFDDGTNIELT